MPHQPDPTDDYATRASQALLRDLFSAVSELPEIEREAWIERHVADPSQHDKLKRLLAADAESASGFLDTPASAHIDRLAETSGDTASEFAGQRIGAFRLVRLLGQGGMASVFLGEREDGDFRQRVAVKLLRLGLHSDLERRLFLRERRALASLSHPHVAQLIDGGVTENGMPFLVMEYVDGTPITAHAEQHALDALARLALFLVVCRAVEAAHRALIVHRDIKPANILVSADGTVKLLDFGIAKLLGEEGGTATIAAFTPGYAAPEQLAGGAITTATDVFALGVLLHELLLGVRPDAGSTTRRPSSRVERMESGAAADPAALRRMLRGDLDTVLIKALDPDPERRYASAGAFADDIARYLAGRPVEAHPPSRWYRARKFVHRHRGGVLVTALLVVALLASLASVLWQAHETRLALAQARELEAFLVGIFDVNAPDLPRDGIPDTKALLAAGAQRALSNESQSPAVRVRMMTALASVYYRIGQQDDAEKLALAGIDLAQRSFGADSPATAAPRYWLANVQLSWGRFDEAIALAQRALTSAEEPALELDLLELLGLAIRQKGDAPAALASFRRLLARADAEYGSDYPKRALYHFDIGSALGRNDPAAAEHWIREAIRIDAAAAQSCGGECTATFQNGLAIVLIAQDRYREAEQIMRTVADMDRRIYGGPHRRVTGHLGTLAVVQREMGDLDAARATFERALALSEQQLGAEHWQTANLRMGLAVVLRQQGAMDSAEPLMRLALAQIERALQPPNEFLDLARLQMAETWSAMKRFDQADPMYLSAIELREQRLGNAAPATLLAQAARALALADAGRIDDARRVVDSIAPTLAQMTIDNAATRTTRYTEGLALARIGDAARAEPLLTAAVATMRRDHAAIDPKIAQAQLALARIAAARGDSAQARSMATQALAVATKGLPAGHTLIRDIEALLAGL